MPKNKQQFGQYMTPQIICDFMVELIEHNKTASILEPSCGDGAFLNSLLNHSFQNITAFEIDKELTDNINPEFSVKNQSFISSDINEKYDVIIGNPPYIRWKNLEPELKSELENSDLWNKHCNSLCDYSNIFIIKAIEQLKEDGELIFITPEYWISTTHAVNLRNFILENGYVKEIYHFNETPIFADVSVSLVIFKFVKSKNKQEKLHLTKYFSRNKLTDEDILNIKNSNPEKVDSFYIPQYKKYERWILADEDTQKRIIQFENKCTLPGNENYESLGTYFEIGNGMVSGLDKAFQIPDEVQLTKDEKKYTIDVVKAKNLEQYTYSSITKYIFINNQITEDYLQTKLPHFHAILEPFHHNLIKRYNYGRNIPYWEWVFLRNLNLFSTSQDKLFVPCKERITNKDRFRFSYIPCNIFPTQDVTALFKKENCTEDLYYVLALLNSKYVFDWLSYKGIRKGDIIEFSEKPVSKIPFRRIDFTNIKESELHGKIVTLTKEYLQTKNTELLCQIDHYIDLLIN